ncbi:MAG: Rieske (2Fe-2S) protein [Bacteroidetes bacterium]|nr:MAG: Rieske (2Fe-2S) protein [Bacteroidota bacterium]
MQRRKFLKNCALGCAGMLAGSSLLPACAGVTYIAATPSEEGLEIPLSAFEIPHKKGMRYRSVVVLTHSRLQYPIAVFRSPDSGYRALWMKCTHQGTELNAYSGRLQCPAHGSEFDTKGKVLNGPAEAGLRSFPVHLKDDRLSIQLT